MFKLVGFSLLVALPAAAQAADTDHLSSVQLTAGRDKTGGSFADLSGGISLKNGDTLNLNGATNRVESEASGETSNTRSFSFAYSFHPDGDWSLTPSVHVWGARSDLTTRSFLLDYTMNFSMWSFGVQPELKSLMWASTDDPDEKKRTGAAGLHVHVDYFGVKRWLLSIHGGSLNYGGERFDQFLDSYVVTDSAFAQSSGLVKSYGGLAVSYRWQDWDFTLNLQKTTYLVGGETGNSAALEGKYRINWSWAVGLEHSSSKVEGGPPTNTNALSAAYSW